MAVKPLTLHVDRSEMPRGMRIQIRLGADGLWTGG